jgi:hypothetical protein
MVSCVSELEGKILKAPSPPIWMRCVFTAPLLGIVSPSRAGPVEDDAASFT